MTHGGPPPPPPGTVDAAPPADVEAAGAVVWRARGKGGPRHGVELLLVHQRRTGEWSWPKGKRTHLEPLGACAVRETLEETGLAVRLGLPLPTMRYTLPTGETKGVHLWAATVRRNTARRADPHEITRRRWVGPDEAHELLVHAQAREVLEVVVQLARAGHLDTAPVVVLRHATARPRNAWTRRDADRPLIDTGRRQARALPGLLGVWAPTTVLSSPWLRCRDTLAPYVAASGVKVVTKGGLAEDGYRREPHKARKHLRTLVEQGEPGLLCTHRPVLHGIVPAVAQLCLGGSAAPLAKALPDHDPYLAPAEALVLHVGRSGPDRGAVLALEQHLVGRTGH